MGNLPPENAPLAVSTSVTRTPKKPHPRTSASIPDTWENLAAIRTAWRSEIRRGATQHENTRVKNAEDKRAERKNWMYTMSSIPNSTDFVCHTCQRHFRGQNRSNKSYSNQSTEKLTGCHGHHPLDGRTIYI